MKTYRGLRYLSLSVGAVSKQVSICLMALDCIMFHFGSYLYKVLHLRTMVCISMSSPGH